MNTRADTVRQIEQGILESQLRYGALGESCPDRELEIVIGADAEDEFRFLIYSSFRCIITDYVNGLCVDIEHYECVWGY